MRRILIIVSLIMLQACQTHPQDPIQIADNLNLDRFMGDRKSVV